MNSAIEDTKTQRKWDKLAPRFDVMAGRGAERRWGPDKSRLYNNMNGNILFLALGTGLDITFFPQGKTITAIDISPKMLEQAQGRIDQYNAEGGELTAHLMDVHNMAFEEQSFDQIFTSCTFCSVPRPIDALASLRRVLKPGGKLFMFEHTGSQIYPLKPMMKLMSLLTEQFGPAMDRPTTFNVASAGFHIESVENIFLDVVKVIKAHNPT